MIKKPYLIKKTSQKDSILNGKGFEKLKKNFSNVFFVLILAGSIAIGYSFLFDTPEEHLLKIELAKYKTNLKILNNELDSINSSLAKIQDKDDNLYRLILGVEPVAKEIREAGIGGMPVESSSDTHLNKLNLGNFHVALNRTEAKLKVQTISFNELTNMATENIERMLYRPSIFPIAPNNLIRFASGFGYRTHPIFHIQKFHKGIDLTALKGTPIYAPSKGTVVIAGQMHDGYGNKVVINHGYGITTVYAHLHKIQVKVGQNINLGEIIGTVGTSGVSIAPHLHYEVRVNDQPVNPLEYVFKDISQKEYSLITQR